MSMDNNNKKNNTMRRESNSFKDYDFDLKKYQEEQRELLKPKEDEVYVKPVDTSVSALVQRGVVADNSKLVYGEDLPPMSKMSLMELHKMKQSMADNIQYLEADLESKKKMMEQLEVVEKVENENVEPKE
jgi:hypothetical protein